MSARIPHRSFPLATLSLAVGLTALSAGCGQPLTAEASAEPETLVLGEGAITLIGVAGPDEASTEPEWRVSNHPEGSVAALVDASSATASFTPDLAGEYEFTFTVRDADVRTGGGLASLVGSRTAVTSRVKVTVRPRPAGKLVFVTQPGDLAAGSAFDPAVTVELQGDDGQKLSEAIAITLALSGGTSGAAFAGTSSATTVDGVATFADLSVDKVGADYMLVASAAGIVSAMSETFDVTFGAPDAATSTFTATPAQALADGVQTIALELRVRDAHGNAVPGVDTTLSADGTGHTLSLSTGVTDATGGFDATIASVVAQTKTVTASFGAELLTAQVAFLKTLPAAASSSLSCAPDTRVADGVEVSTCTVLLADAQGNALEGIQVTPVVLGTGNTVTPSGALTSDVSGQATFTLASTRAEAKDVRLALTDGTLSSVVTFVAGPAAAAGSTLNVAPPEALADGTATVAIAVTVGDAFGNPVAEEAVSLVVGGSGNALTPSALVQSGVDGVAVFALASSVPEVKAISATMAGFTLSGSARFVSTGPSLDESSLEADPTTVAADGTETTLLTATLRDAQGNAVPGIEVTFEVGGSGNVLPVGSATTDGAGEATVTLASTVAELKTVKAKFGAPEQVLEATVSFVARVPLAANSTFFAEPTGLVADGVELSTLTATLRDADDNPVAGALVNFSSAEALDVFSAVNVQTDASGVATSTVRSMRSGNRSVVAYFGSGQTLSVALRWLPGAPVVARSTFTAAPSPVVADGVAATTLTATLSDANGNQVGGVEVTFASDGTGNALTVVAGSTDAAGRATATVASTAAEVKTLKATFGDPPQSLAATVTFVAGPPVAGKSTFTASPGSLAADGLATSALSATLRDANDNPVSGATVVFSSAEPLDVFGAASVQTNASGVAASTVKSTRSGYRNVVASFGSGQTLTSSMRWQPGAPVAGNSTFVASPTGVAANGTETSTLTATLKDAHGNLVPGVPVTFEASGSGNVLQVVMDSTSLDGAATATLASTTAEVKTVKATFGAVPTSLEATVTFTAGAPDAPKSTLAASPAAIAADGAAQSRLTATIRDAQGNPLPGVTVTFSSLQALDVFDNTVVSTSASGIAEVKVQSTVAGVRNLRASFGGVWREVAVTFQAGRPSKDTSTLKAEPASLTADGVAVSTLYAFIRDVNGNPVEGVDVAFSSTGSGHSLTVLQATTDADGAAKATIRSTLAEVKTVTAAFEGGPVSTTVTFLPGKPTRVKLTATPLDVVADGVQFSALSARVFDAFDNLVPDILVKFAATGSGHTIEPPESTTDAAGRAQSRIVSTVIGSKDVTATIDGLSDTAKLKFVAGVPDDRTTTFTGSPLTVVADDVAVSTLTVTVRDALGNPVTGASVVFSAPSPSTTLSRASATTNAVGVATATVRSSAEVVETVRATIDDLFSKNVVVTFKAPAVQAPEIIELTVPNPLAACGTITYRIRQTQSLPVSVRMQYELNGSGTFWTATPHASQGDGVVNLASSPEGIDYTFVWNTTADLPGASFDSVVVRVTPFIGDLTGAEVVSEVVVVENGLRFTGYDVRYGEDDWDIDSGDFNADGYPDLVVVSRKDNIAIVHLNDQKGGMLSGTSYPMELHPEMVEVADLNDDRLDDFVVTLRDSKAVAVALNNGDGGFNIKTYTSGNEPTDVTIADFNGDRRPDIATSNADGQVTVLISAGESYELFKVVGTIEARLTGIVSARFDEGDTVDLVVTDARGDLHFLRGAGDGSFGVPRRSASGGEFAHWPVVVDFDRDGFPDVVVSNGPGGRVAVLRNDTSGRFEVAAEMFHESATEGLAVGDFNGDGLVDVLVNTLAPSTVLWLGNEKDFAESVVAAELERLPKGLVAADFDVDGRLDFASATKSGGVGQVRVELNGTPDACEP